MGCSHVGTRTVGRRTLRPRASRPALLPKRLRYKSRSATRHGLRRTGTWNLRFQPPWNRRGTAARGAWNRAGQPQGPGSGAAGVSAGDQGDAELGRADWAQVAPCLSLSPSRVGPRCEIMEWSMKHHGAHEISAAVRTHTARNHAHSFHSYSRKSWPSPALLYSARAIDAKSDKCAATRALHK